MDDNVLRPRATSSTDCIGAVHGNLLSFPRLETGDTSPKNLASLVNHMYSYFRGSYKIDIDIEVNLRLFTEFTTYIALIDEHIGVVVKALGRFRIQIQADSDRDFHNNIVTTLKSIILELKARLNTFIATSKGLLKAGVGMADPMNKASQLASAWTEVATVIKTFVDALRKNSAADFPGTDSLSAVDSSDEIRSYELADVHGKDAGLAPNKSSHLLLSGDDEKKVEADLGPPDETLKNLEDLRDSTGRVIDQFDDILSQTQPFLKQFKCPLLGDSESDLYAVTLHYRKEFLDLQLATVPVFLNLRVYAERQEDLLDSVVPNNEVQDPNKDIPLNTFISDNADLVEDYKKKAGELSKRSARLKKEWVSIRNTVTAGINKCGSKIKIVLSAFATVADRAAFCAAISAAISAPIFGFTFTAIAFSSEGMLYAFGALVSGYVTYSQVKELLNVISNFFNIIKDTKANIEIMLSHITSVERSLSEISQIWSSIAKILWSLNAFLTGIKKKGSEGFSGGELNKGRKRATKNWVAVKNAVDDYIRVLV